MLRTDDFVVRFSYRENKKKHVKQLTICSINQIEEGDETMEIGIGIAKCCTGDQFLKAKGRKLALNRALQNSGLGKEQRTEIWNNYFQKSK